jgi:CheY-like chemotaxis protein
VEDDNNVRMLESRILASLGYQVLQAPNGPEALSMCAQLRSPIDLVITDVVMPHMSGSQLAAELAAARPGIKVLFTSGYTEDAVIQRGVLSQSVDFLSKPFDKNTLAGKVRDVLDRRS